MQRLSALLAGLLFGAGLALSGMVNPMKVQNFLDLFGTWDPTLIFVMGAGLAVTLKALALVVPKPPWTPSKAPSTSKAKAPSPATSPAGEAAR